jgi:arginase
MSNNIQFIFNESEVTAGTRGASLGPRAIKIAASNAQSQIFNLYPIASIPNNDVALFEHPVNPHAKRISAFKEVCTQVDEILTATLKKDDFPFFVSADHGSAAATLASLKKNNPDKRIGVVWIDAHADLHSPYTTPSGNMHGMPLAIALAEDNKENQVNQPSDETINLWNELKNFGVDGPKINPEDLVFIAVRDTEKPEDDLMARKQLTNYTVDQVRKHGCRQIAQKVLAQLEACDVIYISFDVDSMDPNEVSFGTGTPVKNGLFPVEALDLMEAIVQSGKVNCIEFVEINPCLDNRQNKMAETTLGILEPMVELIESIYLKNSKS